MGMVRAGTLWAWTGLRCLRQKHKIVCKNRYIKNMKTYISGSRLLQQLADLGSDSALLSLSRPGLYICWHSRT